MYPKEICIIVNGSVYDSNFQSIDFGSAVNIRYHNIGIVYETADKEEAHISIVQKWYNSSNLSIIDCFRLLFQKYPRMRHDYPYSCMICFDTSPIQQFDYHTLHIKLHYKHNLLTLNYDSSSLKIKNVNIQYSITPNAYLSYQKLCFVNLSLLIWPILFCWMPFLFSGEWIFSFIVSQIPIAIWLISAIHYMRVLRIAKRILNSNGNTAQKKSKI